MPLNESRTLSIEARVRDFMTRNLSVMQRSVRAFATVAGNAFRSVLRFVNPLSLAIGGFTAAWAAFKGGKTITEILDGVDAMDKLGDSIGTGVERMTLLDGAFRMQGLNAEQFRSTITALGRAMGGVLDRETKNITEGFANLGIRVEDLKNLDAVEIFDQIALSLERFSTAQEKSAALSRIFPRQFQQLFAVVGNGQQAFRELIEQVKFFTGTVTEDAAKAADRFGDALFVLKETIASIGRDAFVDLARRFAPTIERIATFLANNREQIAQGIANLIAGVTQFLAKLGGAFIQFIALVTEGIDKLLDLLRMIPLLGDLIADALAKAFGTPQLSDRARELREEAGGVADALVEVQRRLIEFRRMPEELDPTGQRMQALEAEAKSLENQLESLAAAFDETFPQGRPPGIPSLTTSAKDAASLRQLSDFLKRLADFDNLPAAQGNFGLIRRILWGEGGEPEDVEQEVSRFFEGFGKGVDDLVKKWTDFGTAGRNAAMDLLDGGLEGIVDGLGSIIDRTKGAKQAFQDFARQLLSDLGRIIARLVVMQALNSILGLEKGGVVPAQVESTAPVKRFASGGIAHSPTMALFGEGGNSEAFVPLPDNRSIPVSFTNGGGGGGNVYQFHIRALDSKDVVRVLLEHQNVLRGIFENQAGRLNGMRQVIQRTAG